MIQKLKILAASIIGVFALGFPVLAPAIASADSPDVQNEVCAGATNLQIGTSANNTSNAGACPTTDEGTSKINNIIKTVINVISVIVGIIAVIMIVIGGFRYITSGGDSTKVTNAKNTILYALIGLIIVALAQIVVKFVLSKSISA